MSLFVYMVRCNDHSYYVGVTNDFNRRINEHNDGLNSISYTFSRKPVELVYFQEFQDNLQAFAWETQLKKWSRKKKIKTKMVSSKNRKIIPKMMI